MEDGSEQYGEGVVNASRRSELIVCSASGLLEVQLVRTINYIKVLETYLGSLAVDQSRMR